MGYAKFYVQSKALVFMIGSFSLFICNCGAAGHYDGTPENKTDGRRLLQYRSHGPASLAMLIQYKLEVPLRKGEVDAL